MQIKIFTTKTELGQAAARDAAAIINHAIAERNSAYVIAATGASQFEFLDALMLAPRRLEQSPSFIWMSTLTRRGYGLDTFGE